MGLVGAAEGTELDVGVARAKGGAQTRNLRKKQIRGSPCSGPGAGRVQHTALGFKASIGADENATFTKAQPIEVTPISSLPVAFSGEKLFPVER